MTRGCTTSYEHLPLFCNQNLKNVGNSNPDTNTSPQQTIGTSTTSSGPSKRHTNTVGQYNIQCCSGDFCNNGSFPELPPVVILNPNHDGYSLSYTLKLCLAIFGPVVILGIVAIIIILIMRHNHKKRLIKARNKQDADNYYTSDDLRITQAGDSTLRVSFLAIFPPF